jgi:hypothetical protein
MRSAPLGWVLVATWAIVCVVLALAIIALTMLS